LSNTAQASLERASSGRKRFPRGLAIAVTLLTLALLSVYALQLSALMM
jgi:hypothetical protein